MNAREEAQREMVSKRSGERVYEGVRAQQLFPKGKEGKKGETSAQCK